MGGDCEDLVFLRGDALSKQASEGYWVFAMSIETPKDVMVYCMVELHGKADLARTARV